LLVVLLILTVTIGVIGVNLTANETDRVRDEADRLVALLQTARDEAILQGQIIAVQFQPDGYRFLRIDAQGKLAEIESDETFRPRRLPDDMTLSVEIEGTPATEQAGLVMEPSGQMPPVVLTLRVGDLRWYAVHESAGRLRSRPTRETERAG
jgi:general secretion pathway protein H